MLRNKKRKREKKNSLYLPYFLPCPRIDDPPSLVTPFVRNFLHRRLSPPLEKNTAKVVQKIIFTYSKSRIYNFHYGGERFLFYFFFFFIEKELGTVYEFSARNFAGRTKNRLRKKRATKQVARWKNKKRASLVLSP